MFTTSNTSQRCTDSQSQPCPPMYVERSSKLSDTDVSIFGTFIGSDFMLYFPQSGIVETVKSDTETTGVTQFVDENPDWENGIDHYKDDTYYAADTGDVSLADFFSRPILIGNVAWESNSTSPLALDRDIWSLFWGNPRVVNRICNYRNLRCNMKIKVVINGSRFHFGRAIVAHSPLGGVDGMVNPNSITQLSQMPHIYLDPSTSQGGQLTIPYIGVYNSYFICDAEWSQRATVYVRGLTPLGHLAGNTEKVTISLFAWAEDVVLSGPTTFEPPTLTPQSGKEDEYGKGIISRPATAVAFHAGLLSRIPYLRPYATATQMGAGAIADIARMFGFSRPTNVSETRYAKPVLAQTFANADTTDTIPKLAFDSKQETTVDPRTAGFGPTDQMAFKNIVNRESYLTQFLWKQETSFPGVMLFNIGVSPWVWNDTGPLDRGLIPYDLPACSFISQPFTQWRGTLRYRFQFCNSPMHRGRVRISYDPYVALGGQVEFNTCMNEIVDIGANNDFVIEVGWHHNRSYLPVVNPGNLNTNELYGDVPITPAGANNHNGVLYVHVLNELTTPSSTPLTTNDIRCNVFISACDDFEVVNPDGDFMSKYLYFPQSGTEADVSDSSSPQSAPVLRVFGNKISPDHSLIYNGDPILSIRTAIKRYTYYRRTVSELFDFGNNPFVWAVNQSALPLYKGRVPGGLIDNVNYVHNTPITYFGAAFVGHRGGLRHKFMVMPSDSEVHLSTSVTRVPWSANETNIVRPLPVPLTGIGYINAETLTAKNTGWGGMAATHNNVSPMIEAEIPYHSNRRYKYNRQRFNASSGTDSYMRTEVTGSGLSTNGYIVLDDYVAAADDYSMFMFIGAPSLYKQILALPV